MLMATKHTKSTPVRHLPACLAPQQRADGERYLILPLRPLSPQALKGPGITPWTGPRE